MDKKKGKENMSICTVTKDYHFESAHSLPHLPAHHKCRRPHGHSYRFRVELTGELDKFGFVLDYADIDGMVEPIVAQLDHRDLNEILENPTTAENLAIWIYKKVLAALNRHGKVHLTSRIVFKETANTSVVYPVAPESHYEYKAPE